MAQRRWCPKFSSKVNLAFASVTASRIVYTLCWFNTSASFPVFQASQHYSIEALGVLTTAFFAGAALFQVPAGVFSAHRGAVPSLVMGLSIIAVGSEASALSPVLYVQAFTRFVTGVGAAFYFAPAMVVVSSLFGKSKSGLIVGVYNAAFNLGGGLALLLFTPGSVLFGWRMPYEVTAGLTGLMAAENAWALRGIKEKVKAEKSAIVRTVASKVVWQITAGIVGMAAAYYVASEFMVEYSESKLLFQAGEAGALASVILLGGVVGGPVGGWLADRFHRRKLLTVAPVVLTGAVVASFAMKASYVAWAGAFLLGFLDSAAYTNAYVVPTQLEGIGFKYAPIAIGLINSVGIMGGSVASALFAFSVISEGYPFSWVALGLVVVAFSPFLVTLKNFAEPAHTGGGPRPESNG